MRIRYSKKIQRFFALQGKKGGLARAKKLTAAERSEQSRHAAKARWAQEREKALAS